MEYVEFNGVKYPKFQSEGNAARWIMPLAMYYCQPTGKEKGLDIGSCRHEWAMPNALSVDPVLTTSMDAMRLPVGILWDYIFSSHCLEHIKENWANVLDYWLSKIKPGGVLFLYLPHKSQEYWNCENNRKHIHVFTGDEIANYLKKKCSDVYLTPVDYNNSFAVIAQL